MKRFLAGAFSLLLALGAGIRIWYVNTHVDPRFTPPETKVYQMGEWVELEGNFQFSAQECTDGYAVRLESVEFMTPESTLESMTWIWKCSAWGQRGRCRRLWRI